MRSIKLSIIACFIFLMSCETQEETVIQRVINNNSTYSVEMEVWNDGQNILTDSMKPGESLKYEGVYHILASSETIDFFGWTEADSVVVIADSILEKAYSNPNDNCSNRNVVATKYPQICHGYEIMSFDGVESYVFTFTDADFEDAEVIGD